MTAKHKLFVKAYIDNKGNATKAAKEVYNVTTQRSAESVGSEVLRNPEVQSMLTQYNDLFESTLVQAVSDWGKEDDTRKREVAINTAKWGYEQIHGKATQRTESVSASFISHTSTKAKDLGIG